MEPITSLIGAITGGVSAFVAIWGLVLQLRRINTFEALRKDLSRVAKWQMEPRDEGDAQLLEVLDRAMIVARPLRQRLMARFVLSLLAIGGLVLVAQVDLPGDVAGIAALEPADLFLLALQLMVGVVNGTPYLLDADTKEFLQNLAAIDERFFRSFVVPAIQHFNSEVQKFPWLQAEKARRTREEQRLQDWVRHEVRRFLEERDRPS